MIDYDNRTNKDGHFHIILICFGKTTLGGTLDSTFNIQSDKFLQSLFKKISK